MMEEWIMMLWQPRAAVTKSRGAWAITAAVRGLGSNLLHLCCSAFTHVCRLTWGGCQVPTWTSLLSCSDTRTDYWRSASLAWLGPKSETFTAQRTVIRMDRREKKETLFFSLSVMSETKSPTPARMMALRLSYHCREAGDKLDWVLDVLLRHLHHWAVLLLKGQNISTTLGHPLIYLSTQKTNVSGADSQSLLLSVDGSTEPIQKWRFLIRPIIEPFPLIRHICGAQRSCSLLMTPIKKKLVSLFPKKKKKPSLITAQLF